MDGSILKGIGESYEGRNIKRVTPKLAVFFLAIPRI